jgi:hypothetical protein
MHESNVEDHGFAGGGNEVTIRSRWQEQGDRPVIVDAGSAS